MCGVVSIYLVVIEKDISQNAHLLIDIKFNILTQF